MGRSPDISSVVLVVATVVTISFVAGVPGVAATIGVDELRALVDSRENERAVVEGRALLADVEAKYGAESLEVGEVAGLIAFAMAGGRIGEKQERLQLAVRALAIKQKLLDPRDPSLARAHYTVGLVHNLTHDPGAALEPFARALAIAEAYYGSHHRELEIYVREYGTALHGLGQYAEAKSVYERLNILCRDKYGEGHPGTIKGLFNLAVVHKTLGEFNEAERLYAQLLEILEAQDPPDTSTLTWVLNSFADLLGAQGRLHESLAKGEQVLRLRREHHGPGSEQVAGTLSDLGYTLRLLGDFEKARDYLEESLRIQSLIPVDPALGLKTRVSLAAALRDLGHLDTAKGMFLQARQFGRDAFDEEHSYWGPFHREFGDLLLAQGDRVEAREQYRRSVAVLSATLGERDYHLGLALSSLGRAELALGNPEGARERLERAVSILDEQVGRSHPWYATALDALSAFYYASGSTTEAFEAAVEAERAHRDFVQATLAVLPERQALAQAALPWFGRDVAVSIAVNPGATVGQRRETFDTVIRSRALVFDEMAARQRFYRSAQDPGVKHLATLLERARSTVSNLFMFGPGPDSSRYADRMKLAEREVERLEADLARSSETFRLQLDGRRFGYTEFARRLPSSSAAVSFVRYERDGRGAAGATPYYTAIVLTAGSTAPRFVDLGPAARLERAIRDWRAQLDPGTLARDGGPSEARYRSAAIELRRMLWDPLVSLVADASLVLVIPDGAVHLVSFASLPVHANSYLVERGPAFHYLTAERDLAGDRKAEPMSGGMLVLGDPAFDDRSVLRAAGPDTGREIFRGAAAACANPSALRFGPLPASRAEAAAVKGIWDSHDADSPAVHLVGRQATEDALKRNAAGTSVLHLATHGFFLGETCGPEAAGLRGIGGLTPDPDGRASASGASTVNPLLLSGLALAGANSREDSTESQEDGILTAEEVTALDLSGVRLAVLSACRTGAGTIRQGEGVFGLRRAFLIAGAQTVITNLWDVEDRAAGAWIQRMYRERVLEDRSIPEATRAASLSLLNARRADGLPAHPFYWAGWLAVGRPSS